jgi:UDP-GlcNAc:undecaprenyl-phosphate GlcNAc-1-phosphate transferase
MTGQMKRKTIGPLWYFALAVALVSALPPVLKFFWDIDQRWAWILIFSSTFSFGIMPFAIRFAKRFGIMDIPGGRKDHEVPTPLIGSIPIALAFMLSLTLNWVISPEILSIIVASSIILVVGMLEDVFGVKEWVRLLAQAVAFAVVALAGIVLELFPPTPLGTTLNLFLTFLWIVGITNAMNFIDGMNGLAAGVSVVISFFLGVIAFQTDQTYLGWLSVALMGSTLGFIPYNFVPRKRAKIFLGDAGSSFLGFVLASLAVLGEWAQNDPLVSFSTPLIIFGVLIYDMVYTTVSRIAKGKVKNFSELLSFVGWDHIHHRMYNLLGDKDIAVIFILLVNVILGLGTIALRNAGFFVALTLVIQAVAILFIITILEAGSKRKR